MDGAAANRQPPTVDPYFARVDRAAAVELAGRYRRRRGVLGKRRMTRKKNRWTDDATSS